MRFNCGHYQGVAILDAAPMSQAIAVKNAVSPGSSRLKSGCAMLVMTESARPCPSELDASEVGT